MTAHPRLVPARGPKGGMLPEIRIVVHEREGRRQEWVERELDRQGALVLLGRTIGEIVTALVEDPPPRAQVLIIDFDALGMGEVLELHALRERGWFGAIIAIGTVAPALRTSLAIDRVLSPPFAEGVLCETIDGLGLHSATVRMPLVER